MKIKCSRRHKRCGVTEFSVKCGSLIKQRKILQERSHEVATTCSCRNGSKLLADNVAFTGRGRTGDGLDERHAGACWPRTMRPYGVTVLSMLFLQRHHEARWREVGDVLEELTTTGTLVPQ